jgi:hypothetical protein
MLSIDISGTKLMAVIIAEKNGREFDIKGVVLLGLPHNVASHDIYTDIMESLFLPQLPHESQLLASAGSSSSLTQSILDFVLPPSLCI